jgi:hypothetical protein
MLEIVLGKAQSYIMRKEIWRKNGEMFHGKQRHNLCICRDKYAYE